ncbi:hypothetical protein [Streptomyces sp. NBC_01217]|uniref:hypothetical protein n=1 Tax=Streptomyces sp. NBC_01217 TaxID=2903779 RepID=UPI002E10BF0B|nr:hypothetical protein OG507_21425 [Streptomyces sp. NBC_01217]
MPASGSRTASAGSVAVAAGVAQRMADGSVVFRSPSSPSSPSSPYSSATPVVQRETETAEPPPPEPPQDPEPASVSEPEDEPGPEPVPESEPDSSPLAGAGGAPGASAAAPGGPPVVTDELVRALYTPLSRLFKADLRLERERAGFLINTRH